MLIRFRYSARCETVEDGKTSAYRQARHCGRKKGDFSLRTPNCSRQQTIAKASSILVDRVEQRSCRQRIEVKFNGIGRDAKEHRQARRHREAPYEEQCGQIDQFSCDLLDFVASVSNVLWKG